MKFLRKHNSNIILGIILVVAAFLRLYKIGDYLTFLGDEGRDVLVVYNILHGHLTLLGPTASIGGFFFGPLYYYMMVPFLWAFQYNPVGPAVMIALFGVATVWLVYVLGKTFFTKPVGIIAAGLYAFAPLIISFSRSSWNPNPIPFFSCLLILVLYKAVGEKLAKRSMFLFFLTGLLWGMLFELHFVTGVLVLVIVPYILIDFVILQKKRKLTAYLSAFVSIAAGFIVGMLPYIGFELRHNFQNVRAFVSFIFHPGQVTHVNPILIYGNVFLRLFGRILLDAPLIEKVEKITQGLVVSYIFPAILAAVCIGLFVWQIRKQWKNREVANKLLLVLIWLLGGVIIFGLYKKPIYDYYFGFMYPIPFLLAANLVYFLWRKGNVAKVVSALLFVALITPSILGIPFRYAPNKQLEQTEKIAQFVMDETGGKPYNFALITGGNSDQAYRYFFTIWGHEPVTIENPGVDPKRTSVAKQLLVVCESLPCYPLGNPLWEIAGFGQADIAGKWDVSVVKIYKLVHYHGK